VRKPKLRIPETPQLARARARRDACDVGKYGWRPSRHDLANLRASKRDPIAYLVMIRAWRSAGFKIEAIRRLAGRN
jgi:hypothetical protein